MKIRQLNDAELHRLSDLYKDIIELMLRSGLDAESLIGVLFKASMGIAVSEGYEKDELIDVLEATYEMERFMHPSSDEVH
jgi:hypothetical protein